MTTVTAEQAPDLDAIAADAERRLRELREQESRLSLDALGSGPDADAAKTELADIESEIVAAESAIRRATLAGAERERRDQTAKVEAEQAAKRKALNAADKLAARRVAAGERIDELARALGEAMKAHREIASAEHALRVEAGVVSRATRLPNPYDGAVRFGLAAAGVGNALEPPLGGGSLGPRPMIEKQDTRTYPNRS